MFKSLKKIGILGALLLTSTFAFSQSFAYVDTEYILENIPKMLKES
jgi:Skp family chaperone for outer membrane proteins